MTRKKPRISFEAVGSIVAVIIGLAALFVAWDEARSVRKQQAASVLPVIKIRTINLNNDEGSISSVVVENVGVGPAFVESATLSWDGEPVDDMEALRSILDGGATPYGFWTSRLDGEILAGGEQYNMLSVTLRHGADSDKQTAALRRSIYSKLKVTACFCSVYEDCWEAKLNKRYRPDPVDHCERRPETPSRMD